MLLKFKGNCHRSRLTFTYRSLQHPNSKAIGCSSAWSKDTYCFAPWRRHHHTWQWYPHHRCAHPSEGRSSALMRSHASSQEGANLLAPAELRNNGFSQDLTRTGPSNRLEQHLIGQGSIEQTRILQQTISHKGLCAARQKFLLPPFWQLFPSKIRTRSAGSFL